ncbi:MAG TPA: methenyltetrahydrofolate cyclohydrolase [Anaerolineae bacterium]|nr:methenyltetrahydrofolate cyclohydrolase [Anaerolineae bacterium]HIQ06390.1 methenyltetrahydrofolate cyclohydrolase [Anaerolineae bacterium]
MVFSTQTLTEFLDEVASPTPTPGGGSASAVAGALGSALAEMVAGLTVGKDKYAAVEAEMKATATQAAALRERLLELATQDARAYTAVIDALRLPRQTDEEKATRTQAVQLALQKAAEIPLDTLRACRDTLLLCQQVVEQGNRNAVTDAGVGAFLAAAAAQGAALNVRVNLGSIRDAEFAQRIGDELERLHKETQELATQIAVVVDQRVSLG